MDQAPFLFLCVRVHLFFHLLCPFLYTCKYVVDLVLWAVLGEPHNRSKIDSPRSLSSSKNSPIWYSDLMKSFCSTTELFVFQQSFYWTRRLKNSVVEFECKASENVCESVCFRITVRLIVAERIVVQTIPEFRPVVLCGKTSSGKNTMITFFFTPSDSLVSGLKRAIKCLTVTGAGVALAVSAYQTGAFQNSVTQLKLSPPWLQIQNFQWIHWRWQLFLLFSNEYPARTHSETFLCLTNEIV